MKTKHEIIDETVAAYDGKPRSLKESSYSSCLYKGPNNLRCAFSRCCTPQGIDMLGQVEGAGVANIFRTDGGLHTTANIDVAQVETAGIFIGVSDIDDILLPEYRGYDVGFWAHIQSLHDSNINWNDWDKKLSTRGKLAVDQMKEMYT